MQTGISDKVDWGCEQVFPVTVGYVGQTTHRRPNLPEDYCLHLAETASSLGEIGIWIVAVGPDEAGAALRRLRSRVGGSAYVIALVEAGLGRSWLPRLIELGADDVVCAPGDDLLPVALKKAERALDHRRQTKQAVAAVERERDLLQAAIDSLPAPIYFKNRAGYYKGCNTAFSDVIGMSKDQIRGASVYDVAPPHLASIYYEADEKLMGAGGVQTYESEVQSSTGEVRQISFHKAVMRDPKTGEVTGLAGAMLDITKRKQLEAQLQKAADLDHLTGAYNRRKFFKVAADVEAARGADQELSVLVLDVDNFKQINDDHGHAVGDAVLCHLVDLLSGQLDADLAFARAGGEEFYVLLPRYGLHQAAALAETMRQSVETSRVERGGTVIPYRISIGVAAVEPDEAVSAALIRADKALYKAKRGGRNRIAVARARSEDGS